MATRAERRSGPARRASRIAVLVLGVLACQLVPNAPSLLGEKLLLPLELLARPGYYLPDTPANRQIRTHNVVLSDRVLVFELDRRFAARELRAGRLPLWNPHGYAGAPFVALATYSPFNWLYYLWPRPEALAWIEALVALVAALGAYVFLGRVLGLGFWPAALGAWCYPLTGFFALWEGFPQLYAIAWLPWVLLAAEGAIRRPLGGGGPALAALTALALSGEQLALHVLLTSGLYAAWRLIAHYGWRRLASRPAGASIAVLGLAWTLGIALASPPWLHLEEYAEASARIEARAKGEEDRPPIGLSALPQIVLPDIYGSRASGSFRLAPDNRLESSAGAYAGLFATLFLAPLAWQVRRLRSMSACLAAIGLLSLAWQLNVPGVVELLRLPGLALLSHNRFVFVGAFALVCLAAIGLQALHEGRVPRRWHALVPMLALIGVVGFLAHRAAAPPEPVATELAERIESGEPHPAAPDAQALAEIRASFTRSSVAYLVLGVAALAAWWLAIAGLASKGGALAALGLIPVAELLWFGYGLNPQAGPELYYPPIETLERIAERPPGRMLCIGCLPARLSESRGLYDIRGYDGLDPRRLIELLERAADPSAPAPSYARTQWYIPAVIVTRYGSLLLSPILDMLNVRYLVLRSPRPPAVRTFVAHDDYWATENKLAMPRAYVPAEVRVRGDEETLELLAEPTFDPRQVAYVPIETGLTAGAEGEARIVAETPTELLLSAHMATPGLLVVADLWFEGWEARVNGRRAPILRANYALRGIVLPAGRSEVRLEYRPAGFRAGLLLSLAAAILLLGWLVGVKATR